MIPTPERQKRIRKGNRKSTKEMKEAVAKVCQIADQEARRRRAEEVLNNAFRRVMGK